MPLTVGTWRLVDGRIGAQPGNLLGELVGRLLVDHRCVEICCRFAAVGFAHLRRGERAAPRFDSGFAGDPKRREQQGKRQNREQQPKRWK